MYNRVSILDFYPSGVTVESMVSSFSSMADSMYIAKECLKPETPEEQDSSDKSLPTFEGLQVLADTIDTGECCQSAKSYKITVFDLDSGILYSALFCF